MIPFHKHWLTVLALALPLALIALASPVAADNFDEMPDVVIQARDFSFENPGHLEAGLLHFILSNEGTEPHHAQIAKLRPGVTMGRLQTALENSPEAALPLLEFVGGPNTVDPGGSSEVYLELDAGDYVILCFVAGADNVPHLVKGMIGTFMVMGEGHDHDDIVKPAVAAKVRMHDFAFSLPATLPAGRQTWLVTNEGQQPHEMSLVRLAEGQTLQSLTAWLRAPEGAPPFSDVGGMLALDHARSGWASLDLEPGKYVALCFVPDPASGKPHLELGMITEFTVLDPNQSAAPVEAAQPSQTHDHEMPMAHPGGMPVMLWALLAIILAVLVVFLLKK